MYLNNKRYPDQKYLLECFEYEKETGFIYWKQRPLHHFKKEADFKTWNTRYAYKKAGSLRKNNYLRVGMHDKDLFVHRVVFIMHHGYNPENIIDHIDMNPLNNRIENLRETSFTCNIRNTGVNRLNNSGIKGVDFHNASNKWRARIVVNREVKYLGIFENFDDAVKARWEAECEHNWNNCLSSSTAYKYLKENNLI